MHQREHAVPRGGGCGNSMGCQHATLPPHRTGECARVAQLGGVLPPGHRAGTPRCLGNDTACGINTTQMPLHIPGFRPFPPGRLCQSYLSADRTTRFLSRGKDSSGLAGRMARSHCSVRTDLESHTKSARDTAGEATAMHGSHPHYEQNTKTLHVVSC